MTRNPLIPILLVATVMAACAGPRHHTVDSAETAAVATLDVADVAAEIAAEAPEALGNLPPLDELGPSMSEDPAPVEPVAETPARPEHLPFAQHVAARCLRDQLARTEYAEGWEAWFKTPDFVPAGAPLPQPEEAPMTPLSPDEAAILAAQVEKDWLANPRSHVVDCSFSYPGRDCPGCKPGGNQVANYIAYLPQALFTEPEKVDTILLFVPGGRGGRTRYFLTPVPGSDIYRKKSGGLETKRRIEEYLSYKPDSTQPIVVALDSAGFLSVNGPEEYLAFDLPMHIARTYLGRDSLDGIKLGAEGISSGARAMMDTLFRYPNAFRTVGLTAMHCGGRNGIRLERMGTAAQREAWAETLRGEVERGTIHFRFSVGNKDPGWMCNKQFYDFFADHSVTPSAPPEWVDCPTGKQAATTCSVTWGQFHLVNGHGHNYGILLDSWVPQLWWHLDRLVRTGAPPTTGAAPSVAPGDTPAAAPAAPEPNEAEPASPEPPPTLSPGAPPG